MLVQLAGDRILYSGIHHNILDLYDHTITKKRIIDDFARCDHVMEGMCDVHPKKLVVSFVNEGHGIDQADEIFIVLTELFPQYEISFLFSSLTSETRNFKYRCLPASMVDHLHWLTNLQRRDVPWDKIILDRKFLCLNRRPSRVRERLAAALIRSLKPHAVRLSLGCSNQFYHGPKIWINHNILIDGVVSDQVKGQSLEYKFYSCLFNIIAESSDQSDANVWKSIFLTEKTWRAFGLRQIPIWMAVPGLVKSVRDMGFDVFDDLCHDHDYDDLQNEDQRQDRVVEIVKSIDQRYSILCCRKLRQQLKKRLDDNYQKLYELQQRQSAEFIQALNIL